MHSLQLKFTVIITTLAIFCQALHTQAQTVTAYQTISTDQGLSQGMVFDLLQDREGFIWVATKNGLNRYDGYGFTVFSNDPYNLHSLSSNTIIKLFEDSKGRIWIGTEDAGLNIYDKMSGQFYRIQHNPSDAGSLSGNRIRSIEQLADGRILVATDGAGLNIIDPGADFFKKSAGLSITKIALPGNAQVYGMGKGRNGIMYIGGMDGSVYRFDAANKRFLKLNNGQLFNNGYFTRDSSILINNYLFLSDGKTIVPLFDAAKTPAGNIILKSKKRLWENLHQELYYYDISRWAPGKAANWSEQLAPNKKAVYPFIIDRSGILWAGSIGYGLRKYNTAENKFKTSLLGNSVRWIVPVTPNDLFLGDYLYAWSRLKNDFLKKDALRTLFPVTGIDNFIISKTGDYWLKSDSLGFFKYNPSTHILTPYVQLNDLANIGSKEPMLEDKAGIIWIARLGGEFMRLNTATGKVDSLNINTNITNPLPPKEICTALYEDKQGIYWAGTKEGFAKVVLSGKENTAPQIKWYSNNTGNHNSLNYNNVSCFLDDPAEPENYLWIATKGGGLNRLNKNTNDFIYLTATDGLPDNVVYGILADDDGNIWGSTNKGIFCLKKSKDAQATGWYFRNFTKADGLQDNEFNTLSYAKLSNGNLAFGGVNGLTVFNPKEVLTAGFTPNVFITNILVNNQQVVPGDKTGVLQNSIEQTKSITLNHLQDILTLEFSSLDFTAPLQNKYRYRLEGIDKVWVESGYRRTATYLHLPPGTYTFTIQGSNSQGVWSNKIAQLKINVLPPWWRTWWAYLCYLVLFVFIVRSYFTFTINRAKLKAQLSFEQKEASRIKELDTVKTQLYTNITHEFRTPLTVILGMAQQALNKQAQHPEKNLQLIIRNGKSLLKLVNEMLDLTKLETGKMSLNEKPGDMVRFLRYVIESFHSLAEAQQIGLHFLTDMNSLPVNFDTEKIRQVIVNLLSNAVKFTPEKGNIYITLSKIEHAPDNAGVTVSINIKDTGIGIPEHHLQHVFDRFYQADNSQTRATGGTGIGLSLTRELVKLMHGEITVKSPPAGAVKGSEFMVTLPMQKTILPQDDGKQTAQLAPLVVQDVALPGKEKYHANGDAAKDLILLVEDNADVVAYTVSCLPDYRIAVGNDGQEGFDIATAMVPDLIITDVMMPVLDGFTLVQKLRDDVRTSHIPVIVITAKADRGSKMEGLEKGADAYLEKPFYEDELRLRIKKLLEQRKSLQQYYLSKAGISEVKLSATQNTAIEKLPDSENNFVKQIREMIEENLANPNLAIDHLCKKVFMSRSQLQRKLNALTGYSPQKFIRHVRLTRAKELLNNTDTPVAAVAMDCGFTDAAYFSRVFKQEFGITPQEWRNGEKARVI